MDGFDPFSPEARAEQERLEAERGRESIPGYIAGTIGLVTLVGAVAARVLNWIESVDGILCIAFVAAVVGGFWWYARKQQKTPG